jgi:hypothetical protein
MDKANLEIKKPPILFKETQKLIREVKQVCSDGDLISYWTSNNSRMSSNDLVVFFKLLKDRVKKDKLYLFVKSDGGSGKTALRITHLLREYYPNIITLVPLECASAATMLVLGSDSIQMGPLAYLTAIDTSITHDLSPIDKFNDRVSVSQNELDRVIKLWESKKQKNDLNPYSTLYEHIHPLVFGSVDRASSLSIELTTEILSYHLEDLEEAKRISNHLNSNYPSHSYPITIREAKKIGLKVEALDSKINDLLIRLNGYYSESAQRAYTDYDEINYHDNEILSIIETTDEKIYYQKDKDWHYRKEEQRWVSMNDNSSWRRVEKNGDQEQSSLFFIR